jgi:hypothetical protein
MRPNHEIGMRPNYKIGMRTNHKIGMRPNLNFEKGRAMSAHAKKGIKRYVQVLCIYGTFFSFTKGIPKTIRIAISGLSLLVECYKYIKYASLPYYILI